MWHHKKWVVGIVAGILIIETGINAWLMTHGQGEI